MDKLSRNYTKYREIGCWCMREISFSHNVCTSRRPYNDNNLVEMAHNVVINKCIMFEKSVYNCSPGSHIIM